MKRFHLHLAVRDLQQSVAFYSALFGRAPTKQRADYAKWQLDDPRLNFAISPTAKTAGVDHLGFEFESADALQAATEAWQASALQVATPAASTCCYADSEKTWLRDPQGTSWEAFVTHRDAETYDARPLVTQPAQAACCAGRSRGG
jgi:catechol 2,3-dioxygenase-like lactoylglutathione lyase family enzyme